MSTVIKHLANNIENNHTKYTLNIGCVYYLMDPLVPNRLVQRVVRKIEHNFKREEVEDIIKEDTPPTGDWSVNGLLAALLKLAAPELSNQQEAQEQQPLVTEHLQRESHSHMPGLKSGYATTFSSFSSSWSPTERPGWILYRATNPFGDSFSARSSASPLPQ